MNSLLVSALLVASTLVAMTDSIGVTVAVGTTTGLAATAAAVGGLAIVAKAIGAKKLLKHRRGKREDSSCIPIDNPEIYFALAANGDFLDCGRRFVCEVEATPVENLANEELLIRNLFSRGFIPVNGSAGNYYAEAGRIRAIGGERACVEAFSKCPYDRKTIFLAFQEIKAEQ